MNVTITLFIDWLMMIFLEHMVDEELWFTDVRIHQKMVFSLHIIIYLRSWAFLQHVQNTTIFMTNSVIATIWQHNYAEQEIMYETTFGGRFYVWAVHSTLFHHAQTEWIGSMTRNCIRSDEKVVPDILSRTLSKVNGMRRIDPGGSYQGVSV